MQRVINLLIMLHLGVFAVGQAKSDKLLKEQKKTEKKIDQTKKLLVNAKNNSKSSLTEISLLDNQIQNREKLVAIYNNQVIAAESQLGTKENNIASLKIRLSNLKSQYKKMLVYAYKNRSARGRLMFLLTASNINEAKRRNVYLKKITSLEHQQIALIRKNNQLYNSEILEIKQSKLKNETAESAEKGEKELIELDKKLKENKHQELLQIEQKLLAQLKEGEIKKELLKQQINAAIKREIAVAQEVERKKNLNKTKSQEKNSKKNVKAVPVDIKNEGSTKKKGDGGVYISSEGNVIGKNFEGNKGRLPSPVSNGSITEKFGKNAHPTLAGVYTNNNGIDITCAGNSTARSVFEGVVSAVINVNGAGKVVIIKHGNYRSVYSNLQSTYVKVGDKINSKQNLGTVMLDDETFSILHFEIHLIVGSGTQSLNPSLWINR